MTTATGWPQTTSHDMVSRLDGYWFFLFLSFTAQTNNAACAIFLKHRSLHKTCRLPRLRNSLKIHFSSFQLISDTNKPSSDCLSSVMEFIITSLSQTESLEMRINAERSSLWAFYFCQYFLSLQSGFIIISCAYIEAGKILLKHYKINKKKQDTRWLFQLYFIYTNITN